MALKAPTAALTALRPAPGAAALISARVLASCLAAAPTAAVAWSALAGGQGRQPAFTDHEGPLPALASLRLLAGLPTSVIAAALAAVVVAALTAPLLSALALVVLDPRAGERRSLRLALGRVLEDHVPALLLLFLLTLGVNIGVVAAGSLLATSLNTWGEPAGWSALTLEAHVPAAVSAGCALVGAGIGVLATFTRAALVLDRRQHLLGALTNALRLAWRHALQGLTLGALVTLGASLLSAAPLLLWRIEEPGSAASIAGWLALHLGAMIAQAASWVWLHRLAVLLYLQPEHAELRKNLIDHRSSERGADVVKLSVPCIMRCADASRPNPPIAASLAGAVLVCAAACVTPPAHIAEETPKPQQACALSLTPTGALSINGAATTTQLAPDGVGALKTWALDADTVLVTTAHAWHDPLSPPPSGVLWRVSCASRAVVPLLERRGADFSNAALDDASALLFFTDTQGASVLNLRTGEPSIVTIAPDLPRDCWTFDPVVRRPLTDAVHAVDGDTLTIHRGGPCGFEGGWRAAELRFARLGHTVAEAPHQPHPVSALAVDAGGHLWLGDAGRCDEPGVQDIQTDGSVWTSPDAGDTWTRIPVRGGNHRMFTAAAQILADATRPELILVRSATCRSEAVTRGGSLFLSADRGASWARVELPGDLVHDDGGAGYRISWVQTTGGDLDHLLVWAHDGNVLATDDRGQTWRAAPKAAPAPASEPRVAAGYTFTLTDDGLLRRRQPGDKATRVFPRVEEPSSPIHEAAEE